jgi:hypothetical protein
MNGTRQKKKSLVAALLPQETGLGCPVALSAGQQGCPSGWGEGGWGEGGGRRVVRTA